MKAKKWLDVTLLTDVIKVYSSFLDTPPEMGFRLFRIGPIGVITQKKSFSYIPSF